MAVAIISFLLLFVFCTLLPSKQNLCYETLVSDLMKYMYLILNMCYHIYNDNDNDNVYGYQKYINYLACSLI